jgi:hypothetical protein
MAAYALNQEIKTSSKKRASGSVKIQQGTNNNVVLTDSLESKKEKKMTPTPAPETMKIQKTVFDLTAFAPVLLKKEVPPPEKPQDLESALAAVGNDKEKLLDIIYKGLTSAAREAATNDMSGFKVVNEDGELGEDYNGKFADEVQGDKINAAILVLAKLQGYDKSLPPEKKKALKEKAADFLRANPAMLQSI